MCKSTFVFIEALPNTAKTCIVKCINRSRIAVTDSKYNNITDSKRWFYMILYASDERREYFKAAFSASHEL